MTDRELLVAILAVLVEIRDTQPRLAYGAADAGRQLGIGASTVRQQVRDGLLAKVPHLGDRVVIAHGELVRRVDGGAHLRRAS